MSRQILIGQTDYSVFVYIPDPASTDGSGKTGLVAANLTVSYSRMETDNDATVTDATSSLNDLAALTTVHTDWGLKEVSNTLAPGLYRLDIADAVFASGAWTAVVYVMITSSAAAASPLEFDLRAVTMDTLQSAVNAEVVDVLSVDTFAEPTGAPGATTTLQKMLGYLYSFGLRNKVSVTSTTKTFYDDGGASEFTKGLSDDGTTYAEAEAS